MGTLEQQLEIEQQASDFSYNRLMAEINKRIEWDQADELQEGKLILIHSIDVVAEKIKDYFNADIRGKMKAARDMVALEFHDRPKDLAFVILATIVRNISKDAQVPTTTIIKQLTKSLYESILIRRMENRRDNNIGAFVDTRYAKRSKRWRHTEKMKIIKRQAELNDTSLNDTTTYLGGMLLDLVIKSGANIVETKNVYQKGGRKQQYVVYTEQCFRMVLQSRDRLLAEYRKYPVMVLPPLPWTEFNGSGGYYNTEIYEIPIVKARSSSKKLLQKYFREGDVGYLYRVLNTLQETPWRVNRRVYEVMDRVFNGNMVDEESAWNNPYLVGGLPFNERMEPEDYIDIHRYGEINTEGPYKGKPKDAAMTRKYFQALEAQKDIIQSTMGKAIMLNLVMYNAKEFLDEPEIFFSYQYDFRGRIYPIQQHLQPQGKGEVKALLEFANGCKIETEEQLEWFLIHGANCYGYDKDPYSERISKIKTQTEEILAIASDPIGNRLYWKDADEPYLYLAWCFEYSEYLADPVHFESHIPIALDATCSGIQIYSGLLRDKDGAEAVNVIGDTRNDIYQRVADRVNNYLNTGDYPKEIHYTTSDKKEHSVPTQALADSLKGKVTRKLTKRNTMTQPYSVTRFGMYEQLKEEFQKLVDDNKKFWVGDVWFAAKLMTELNDRSIAETVKGARIGQEYLKEVTADLVKQGEWVFYTVPLTRFPVLQKIHKTKLERVNTPIGKLSIKTALKGLHQQKMVNGIAPNFIHSLDAALLAATVTQLADDGCTDFHLIHDSYGVPVNQVPNLNKRVREAFVELFEQEPLRQWVMQVHPTYEVPPEEVMINTLDLSEVIESSYIFS